MTFPKERQRPVLGRNSNQASQILEQDNVDYLGINSLLIKQTQKKTLTRKFKAERAVEIQNLWLNIQTFIKTTELKLQKKERNVSAPKDADKCDQQGVQGASSVHILSQHMEKAQFTGDSPSARFGHTITPIGKDRAILFGGAVGDTGKYIITGDTFLLDYNLRKWKKLDNHGIPPTNRAAHNSLSVDHFFYVFGGALGGGELADDNLYQLDFLTITDKAYWEVKNCKGSTPGARYGHVMAYLKPYIVVYGGNTGSQAVGDIWKIDITGNCIWEKVNTGVENPPPRVYHSASICRTGTASGMMVIFGGRGNDSMPLNDTWGLRKHRDGRLDWMRAPYRNNSRPAERYQHRSMFVGTLLMIIGGRSNQVGQSMPLDIYDTDSSDWYKLPNIDRFRHICFMIEHNVYIHGGFDQQAPNIPTDSILKIDLNKTFSSYPALFKGLAFEMGKDVFTATHNSNPRLRGSRDHQEQRRIEEGHRQSLTHQAKRPSERMDIEQEVPRRKIYTNKSIRLCPEAIVANFNEQQQIKKVHIDMLPTEHRRLVGNTTVGSSKDHIQKIHRFFLNTLFLRPSATITYPIPSQYINKLLEQTEKVLDEEPTLVKLRAPVKIFGDIHGQVNDINRFFEAFGAPAEEPPYGDIEYTNYLFLGDYVDRGNKSIQTILLLFSLKIKYPQNVILLRGAHQDKQINKTMGFGDECALKLKENIDDQYSFFNRVNKLFQKLPLAATIEDDFFCAHGGIGHTLKSITEVQKIERPLRVNHDPKTKIQKIVYELLWSDPCRPGEAEYSPNYQHDYLRTKSNMKFSEDRANIFCSENSLSAIVRSHQPFFDGFDSRESIITVFSSSDYGNNGNKGAIVHITKNGEVAPKILPSMGAKDRWLNLEQFAGRRSLNSQQSKLRQLSFTPPKK